MPASRHQDHTTSPSAMVSFASRHYRVHRILRPTSVTMAKRPSCGHRIPTILPVIWQQDQSLRTATDWHDGQITVACPSRAGCQAGSRGGRDQFECGREQTCGRRANQLYIAIMGVRNLKTRFGFWLTHPSPQPPATPTNWPRLVDITTG